MSPSYHYLPWVREGAAHAFDEPGHARAGAREADGDAGSRRCRSACSSTTARASTCRCASTGPATSSGSTRAPSCAPTRSRARPTSSRTTSPASSSTTPTSRGSSRPPRPGRTGGCGRGSCSSSLRQSEDVTLTRRAASCRCRSSTRRSAELPDLIESWAWAHAQVVQMDATQPVEQLLTSQPDQNLSRLLCPRRLEPETRVPRLRRAGVRRRAQGRARRGGHRGRRGQARAGVGRDEAASCTLPVYYHWEFATGAGGDFETLARRLQPQPVARERRPAAAPRRARSRSGCPNGGVLQLEGALVAPGAFTRPAPTDAFRQRAAQARSTSARASRSSRRRSTAAGSRRATTVPADADQPAWLARAEPRPVRARGRRARRRRRPGGAGSSSSPPRGSSSATRPRCAPSSAGSRSRSPCSARSCAAASQPMEPGRLVQFLGPGADAPAHLAGDAARRARAARACRRRSARPRSARVRPAGRAVARRLPARAAAAPGDRDPARHVAAGARAGSGGAPGSSRRPETRPAGEQDAAHRDPGAPPLPGRGAAALRDYVEPVLRRAHDRGARRSSASRPSSRRRCSRTSSRRQTAPPRFYARVSATAGAVAAAGGAGRAASCSRPSFPQPMYESLRDLSPELPAARRRRRSTSTPSRC